MLPSLLRAFGVSKQYGGVQALRDAHFDLRAGEVHALVGENGAGKSTLVKILKGVLEADSGQVHFSGDRRREIAAIYQSPALFPDLTVAENLAFSYEPPGYVRRVHWAERNRRARQLLHQIGAQIDPEAEVRTLGMAQQQLVEIARALGAQTRVLILDEPTASLGETDAEHLFTVLRRLRSQSAGLIYISHRLEELPRIADRVTVLRDGAVVGTYAMAEVDRPRLIQLMVGREVSQVSPARAGFPGAVVLEAGGIQLRRGEIVGMAGLVGAGRTEFAEALFGLRAGPPITLDGLPVRIAHPRDAVARGIAYVPEDRRCHGVLLEMTNQENLSLASLARVTRSGFLDPRRERELAEDYSARLCVKAPSVRTRTGDLSGGNQQKIALGRWLATSPRILLLDEPTQGIDVGAKAEIHSLIRDLAAQGMGILLISSELPELLALSDRVAVMRQGRIVAVLDSAQATQEQVLHLAL